MSTEVSGVIEGSPPARILEEDDEDPVRYAALGLFLINVGNAYDAFARLFGVRDSFAFRPLSEDRGLPEDASQGLRETLNAWSGPQDAHGTTWISWAEFAAADWDEPDRSGALGRSTVAGTGTHRARPGRDEGGGRVARPGARPPRGLVRLSTEPDCGLPLEPWWCWCDTKPV
ncbi:hypothetical protein AB0D38_25005 [Streptomyces sp. NPDC048279]|uniref:hypothetical protein n=1 Tax=Streptomyces sp. NPDC048279 TaxID=3154714 RepID=UPI00341FDC7C